VGNIVDTLKKLEIKGEDFVYLNYEDSVSVWHITDDYIDNALDETDTASKLAMLLATPGLTVYSRYEENILDEMRSNDLLEGYNRDGCFEEYLTETLQRYAYEYDLLTISTERQDHKRGTCAIAANVKVRASELYELGALADAVAAGFDVVVQTNSGTLVLS
jgi:hypothetical protein